jgi:hypothetical protein
VRRLVADAGLAAAQQQVPVHKVDQVNQRRLFQCGGEAAKLPLPYRQIRPAFMLNHDLDRAFSLHRR